MTPKALQDELVADITALLSNYRLQTKTGERRAPIVYAQDLPIATGNDDDEEDYASDVVAPYIIVRISDGTFDSFDADLQISVMIIICTYDDDPQRKGIADILSIIQRIYQRFAEDPGVGQFTCVPPIDFAIQSEVETFPQYFGAMSLTFSGAGVRRVDPLT